MSTDPKRWVAGHVSTLPRSGIRDFFELVAKMKEDPAFRDPDNSVDVGTPEVRFVIDRTRAADLGVNATDISRALNIAAAGQRVSTFNEGTKQYDVVVLADR